MHKILIFQEIMYLKSLKYLFLMGLKCAFKNKLLWSYEPGKRLKTNTQDQNLLTKSKFLPKGKKYLIFK